MKLSVEPSAFARIAKTFVSGNGDGSVTKDSDLLSFQQEGEDVCKTMSRMATKLEEIDKDADPRKRIDVSISMDQFFHFIVSLNLYF